jgi:hypothetical protein
MYTPYVFKLNSMRMRVGSAGILTKAFVFGFLYRNVVLVQDKDKFLSFGRCSGHQITTLNDVEVFMNGQYSCYSTACVESVSFLINMSTWYRVNINIAGNRSVVLAVGNLISGKWKYFSIQCSLFSEGACFLEDSQIWPVCATDKTACR